MKHLKKVIALVIAAMMIASMSVSVLANSITITQSKNDKATHTYGAYQIFKGTVKDGTLENITWGDNIDQSKLGALATALNAMKPVPATGADPLFADLTATDKAAAFAAAIGKLEGSSNDSAGGQKIAEAVYKAIKKTPAAKTGSYTTPNSVYKIDELDPGYYLVEDTEAPTITTSSENSGAKTRYMLQLVGDVSVTEKADAPSVDKEVKDEAADKDTASHNTDGWGETADHAINEPFQFKLSATIPAEVDLAKYKRTYIDDNGNEKTNKYTVIFTDTMSEGVTFDSIESVKVNSTPVTLKTETNQKGYTTTAREGQAGGNWTLTIDDLLDGIYTPANPPEDVVIEVIYNAHLNEKAKCYDTDQDNANDNKNTVKLQYSNNPNAAGELEKGETKEDSVFVFTYNVDNTKYGESIAESHVLKDAGFKLYKEDGTTEVGLIWDASMSAYRPIKTGETGVEMKSQEDGTFNIKGLDTGVYVIKETTVPAGYNKAADVTITIAATHTENPATTGGILTLQSTSEHLDNSVVNKTGTVLPSTGGIGTTLFYVIGAILVLGAGVLLITRRRMNAN